MPRLEHWYMSSDADDFTAPELTMFFLCGNIFGDPRWSDGWPIRTSRIVSVPEPKRVITETGSEYTLGEPHPDYVKQFPLAADGLVVRSIT